MKIVMIFLFLVVSFNANAVDDKNEFEVIAMEFAKCNGIYEANADFFESIGKAAAAEKFMGQSRGAKMASAYLFSSMDVHTGKSYGELFSMVESYAYGYKSDVAFVFENGSKKDVSDVMDMLNVCVIMNPLQKEIVQKVRKDIYASK